MNRHRRNPFRAHLRRRIFAWFGVTILTTGLAIGAVSHLLGGVVAGSGERRSWAPIFIALVVLWAMSGVVARRLSTPFLALAEQARRMAHGDLRARPPHIRERDEEARLLADVLGQMQGRIRQQLDDQRALLAAVSHEIRSPLARMRLLLEFARQGKASSLDQIETEIVEMDALVGDLLASSRIDFAAIGRTALDAEALARQALERAGGPPEALVVSGTPFTFEGDATLVSRAISNLLENAKRHGEGIVALRLTRLPRAIAIDVDDRGPGLSPGEERTIFDPFSRKHLGKDPASAGLGLALVKRIAEAHGGEAHATNRREGGATFGFSVAAR